ncbi:MAG: hypothetical protein ACRD2Z_13410 [Thermoanaerobaculia bacterium]
MSEPMPIPQESPESLDKVRDILFGSQMRAVDQRLEQLEKRMQRELTDLRGEIDKRFAQISTSLDKGLAKLQEAVAAESARRAEEVKDLRDQARGAAGEQTKAMRRVEESFAEAVAALRHEKADTASLVQLLADMAERLAGDLEDPAKG